MMDINTIIEALFVVGIAILIDMLALFIIQFIISVFIVHVTILLSHLVAKALNIAIWLKRFSSDFYVNTVI